MPSALLPLLLAAIDPIAAYCARTPAGNKHADHCAALINEVSGYVDAVEAAEAQRQAQPDWGAIAAQMVSVLEFPPPTNPLILRCQHHLAQPHLHARVGLPLAQRMLAAEATSHHLGLPNYLR